MPCSVLRKQIVLYLNLENEVSIQKFGVKIIDKKYLLTSKSAYDNDFWRSCDTEMTGEMMLNIQRCITGINYIWQYIQIENRNVCF